MRLSRAALTPESSRVLVGLALRWRLTQVLGTGQKVKLLIVVYLTSLSCKIGGTETGESTLLAFACSSILTWTTVTGVYLLIAVISRGQCITGRTFTAKAVDGMNRSEQHGGRSDEGLRTTKLDVEDAVLKVVTEFTDTDVILERQHL